MKPPFPVLRQSLKVAWSARPVGAALLIVFACINCSGRAPAPSAANAGTNGLPDQIIPHPFGVNIHFVETTEAEMDALAAAGFGFVRMDLGWESIEKNAGQYDFTHYDKLAAAMARRGLRILFILDYGNPLYDAGLAPHTPAGRSAFARFAAAAAAHFARYNIIWEIWNEPQGGLWKPQPNVEDYAALALATIDAVRQADPRAVIVGPAAAGFTWQYLDVLGRRGVLGKLDAVTVHPYRRSGLESVEADYDRLRLLLHQYSPRREIPIMAGEWGYSTAWPGVSEDLQARYLARQALVNLAHDVRLTIWYDWRDDGTDPTNEEHRYGITRSDLTRKPAYQAATTLNRVLGGFRFLRRLATRRSDDYVLLLRKGEQSAVAAWTTGDPHRIELPLEDDPGVLTAAVESAARTVDYLGRATQAFTRQAAPRGAGQAGQRLVCWLDLGTGPSYSLLAPSAMVSRSISWRPAQSSIVLDSSGAGPVGMLVENDSAARRSVRIAMYALDGTGELLGQVAANLPPRRSSTITLPIVSRRYDLPSRPAKIELVDTAHGGPCPLLQTAWQWLAMPAAVRVTVLPRVGRLASAYVESEEAGTLNSSIHIKAGAASATAALRRPPSERRSVVSVALPQAAPVPVSVQMQDAAGHWLWRGAPIMWGQCLPVESTAAWTASLEGDPTVDGSAVATIERPQPPVPQPGIDNAVRIAYRFGNGWKYSSLVPPATLAAISGRPTGAGMWLYGDGSGNVLLARFSDSTGQGFQPTVGPCDWLGWRFVTMDWDTPGLHHWGGANDGIVHYPVRWESVVLVDNQKQHAGQNFVLYVAGVAVRY